MSLLDAGVVPLKFQEYTSTHSGKVYSGVTGKRRAEVAEKFGRSLPGYEASLQRALFKTDKAAFMCSVVKSEMVSSTFFPC